VFTRLEVDGAPHVLCVYSNLTEQRQVERQIIDAVQRAQRRIGADLHDGLGQELTGIAMMLRSLQSDAADGARVGAAQIEEVVALINASIETARTMARGLAPIDPEHGGLVGALQRLVDSSSRQSGVRVELRNRVAAGVVFSPEESTHLFRIAQEAVSNALRHAEPRTVQVALDLEGGFATLSVRDDGRGFPDGSEPERGLGLKTMRFRASMMRGDLEIVRNAARSARTGDNLAVPRSCTLAPSRRHGRRIAGSPRT
jgi:signal transduction histidine kinase